MKRRKGEWVGSPAASLTQARKTKKEEEDRRNVTPQSQVETQHGTAQRMGCRLNALSPSNPQ